VPFDGVTYTREQTAIDLLAVEQHCTDGSALKASCSCIQERHLLSLKGHCQEGQAIAENPAEKAFYRLLHQWASETLELVYSTLKKSFSEQKSMYEHLGNNARQIRVN
jgi:hypothetical protein